MPQFDTTPIPYVEIGTQAAAVRSAIDVPQLSAANSFGGLQKLAIPGPYATDAEASTGGVPDDNLYFRSDGTVRAASHISLDLAFALDKTLTARTGPTPTFSRASSGLFVNANGILVGKTAGTTVSLDPTTTTAGTTQVTVTVASGSVVGWLVGQSVSLIVDTDGGNDNDASELWLVGTIVSMTATELVFTVTEKTGTAGSATAWTLGYRGPRFDHDATGVCKGLLIEEPRTNLLTYSEDMTVANGWNEDANAGTVAWSNNATTSPSGLVTAEKLTEASTTSARRITVKSVVTVVGTTYTLSVYAKASERSILQIAASSGFTIVTQNFDLTNVALGTGDATGPSIVSVGSGWYRCSIQVVSSATGSSLFAFGMVPAATSGRFTAYTGVVGNGLFLWGAQVEAGAFPTSYIPTTSGTAARSADVCSIVGTDFSSFYNQSEGTLFASASTVASSASLFSPSSLRRIVSATDGSAANRAGLLFNTSNPSPTLVVSSGGNLSTLSAAIGSSSVASLVKIAGVYKLNDFAISANGSVVSVDDLGLVGVGINRMGIGNQNEIEHLNGHIARIQYFRKRLANAKLQTLTAP